MQRRHALALQPQAEAPAIVPAAPAVAEPIEAIDPVCGMSVAIAGARHIYEHAGERFYFCCAGCRNSFSRAPEQYLLKR